MYASHNSPLKHDFTAIGSALIDWSIRNCVLPFNSVSCMFAGLLCCFRWQITCLADHPSFLLLRFMYSSHQSDWLCNTAAHYFFESESALSCFLANASIQLVDQGYFYGVVPTQHVCPCDCNSSIEALLLLMLMWRSSLFWLADDPGLPARTGTGDDFLYFIASLSFSYGLIWLVRCRTSHACCTLSEWPHKVIPSLVRDTPLQSSRLYARLFVNRTIPFAYILCCNILCDANQLE